MEVFKKMEQISTCDFDQDELEDLPDTLKMTMESSESSEPIDFHCEAVKKDDGSVQYECRFVKEDKKDRQNLPRVTTGKFSLNVPYVFLNKNLDLNSRFI